MTQKQQYTGLTPQQVAENRKKYGENILTPPEKDPLWRQFLEKFREPLIIILLVAGLLSVGIACYEHYGLDKGGEVFFEPVGIFVAIMLATGLSFYFEWQANKEFAILNHVNDDEPVEVIRQGNTTMIPRRELVVEDVVVLNTGMEVPADAVLLTSTSLQIDESTLTGEPICHKSERPEEADPDATYPTNQVMKGTKVMEGHAICRVTAVGDHTAQGKVFEAVQIDNSIRTPLDEQLGQLGKWITVVSYIVATGIVVGRIVAYLTAMDHFQWIDFTAYMLQTFMIAVTLIVVSVPEGLPMTVTLCLAYSMRRMLKSNNLVRKMHACETMGATTVVCTDKTGTLTENQMRVDEMKLYGTTDADIVAEGLAVNATASLDYAKSGEPAVLGNPTEGALLLWLHSQGNDYRTIRLQTTTLAELPFSTEHKFMATVVESVARKGQRILYVKGAPEIVFAMCQTADVERREIDQQLAVYQQRAMRTLGFAYQILEPGAPLPIVNHKLQASCLHFIGIAAIADPVRSDVPQAINECMEAGIKVKIVTGDTPGTAREIARQIGLWNDHDTDQSIITGPEFEALSDEEVRLRVEQLKIIARARPMDKRRLVEALQKNGEVVAVTGDGTNDAPALRAAHVGLSMGDGTSVAKEASDITIIDNSFSSIGKAVMWGRSLYQNIQRFLLFQLTVNVTACLLVLFGAFMDTESPLTVTQMLWINLIMDTFAAMALASLPPSHAVMKDKPRNRYKSILTKEMLREIVGVGLFFFLLLLTMLFAFQHTDITSLTDFLQLQLSNKRHISAYELTLLFTVFVMTHFFYLFNARAFGSHRSALHFKGCKGLITIVVIIFVGQVAMVETPGFQKFFNVVSLRWTDWLIIIAGSSLVLWIREAWNLLVTQKRI
ncbi:calcium-translocating P-type ATPase, PMCA-type [Prevotella sp. P4-119]|uniref:calcium-translocating P-type ATPase, PMCA-type n=1 Tax=Prevotella sp. P4-119 TaxID=2024218 RepID=UPI000B9791FC|nr:calcium-translocating P-type ATPase, PMCA-type [Prevotella sp. P4-119]OYP43512.1 calcium-translocating P-type ATPase, PMCA-type [Prevotella sp. P4-119]